MNIRLLVVILWLVVEICSAQTHELGVFVGGSNPIADVGRASYVFPNKMALGGLYKWNFHERLSLRVQLAKTKIVGNDLESDILGKQNRQFRFKNELTELLVAGEYNFFSYSMHNRLERPLTPYLSTGVSYFWHDDLYYETPTTSPSPQQAKSTFKRKKSFAVPIILGVKAKVGMRFVVAFEVGTRFTFTNNLDGSMPEDNSFSIGNKNANDSYTFTGFTLTYTFGEKSCYCR